jgi:hypothetical protein
MSMKHWIAVITLGIVALTTPSQALILHDDDAPTVHPTDSIVGQWSTNGSCVAIGRSDWDYTDYVITTRHQNGGVGTTVTFGGVQYTVAEQWMAPKQGTDDPPDLRIVRIETMGGDRANLSNFTQWYDGSSDASAADIVASGFGKGRAAGGVNYYNWADDDNDTQRWGSNTTTNSPIIVLGEGYKTAGLQMDFGNVASKECAIAEYDSGGGWFMDVDTTEAVDWQLVGLNLGADVLNKSYYAPSTQNGNYAVRISSYASWIDSTVPTVPEPATLSLLACGAVAILKRRRLR